VHLLHDASSVMWMKLSQFIVPVVFVFGLVIEYIPVIFSDSLLDTSTTIVVNLLCLGCALLPEAGWFIFGGGVIAVIIAVFYRELKTAQKKRKAKAAVVPVAFKEYDYINLDIALDGSAKDGLPLESLSLESARLQSILKRRSAVGSIIQHRQSSMSPKRSSSGDSYEIAVNMPQSLVEKIAAMRAARSLEALQEDYGDGHDANDDDAENEKEEDAENIRENEDDQFIKQLKVAAEMKGIHDINSTCLELDVESFTRYRPSKADADLDAIRDGTPPKLVGFVSDNVACFEEVPHTVVHQPAYLELEVGFGPGDKVTVGSIKAGITNELNRVLPTLVADRCAETPTETLLRVGSLSDVNGSDLTKTKENVESVSVGLVRPFSEPRMAMARNTSIGCNVVLTDMLPKLVSADDDDVKEFDVSAKLMAELAPLVVSTSPTDPEALGIDRTLSPFNAVKPLTRDLPVSPILCKRLGDLVEARKNLSQQSLHSPLPAIGSVSTASLAKENTTVHIQSLKREPSTVRKQLSLDSSLDPDSLLVYNNNFKVDDGQNVYIDGWSSDEELSNMLRVTFRKYHSKHRKC
jgi:hypothetical protein